MFGLGEASERIGRGVPQSRSFRLYLLVLPFVLQWAGEAMRGKRRPEKEFKLIRVNGNELKALQTALLVNRDDYFPVSGGDVRNALPNYDDTRLLFGWRVEYTKKEREVYLNEKRKIASDMRSMPARKMWEHSEIKERFSELSVALASNVVNSSHPSVLSKELNEVYLFHGSRVPFILTILKQGLRDPQFVKKCTDDRESNAVCRDCHNPNANKCCNGAFGCGVYLATDPEKIEQYMGTAESDEELDTLLSQSVKSSNMKRSMMQLRDNLLFGFVVRTTLGSTCVASDQAKVPEYNGSHFFCEDVLNSRSTTHSQYVPSWGSDYAPSNERLIGTHPKNIRNGNLMRHDEFVVSPDGERSEIAYVFAYTRCMGNTRKRKHRLAKAKSVFGGYGPKPAPAPAGGGYGLFGGVFGGSGLLEKERNQTDAGGGGGGAPEYCEDYPEEYNNEGDYIRAFGAKGYAAEFLDKGDFKDICNYPAQKNRRNCNCNRYCKKYDNCCRDYDKLCGGSAAPPPRRSSKEQVTCEQLGCEARYSRRHSCACNSACPKFGNCCEDYESQCGGGGYGPPPPRDGPNDRKGRGRRDRNRERDLDNDDRDDRDDRDRKGKKRRRDDRDDPYDDRDSRRGKGDRGSYDDDDPPPRKKKRKGDRDRDRDRDDGDSPLVMKRRSSRPRGGRETHSYKEGDVVEAYCDGDTKWDVAKVVEVLMEDKTMQGGEEWPAGSMLIDYLPNFRDEPYSGACSPRRPIYGPLVPKVIRGIPKSSEPPMVPSGNVVDYEELKDTVKKHYDDLLRKKESNNIFGMFASPWGKADEKEKKAKKDTLAEALSFSPCKETGFGYCYNEGKAGNHDLQHLLFLTFMSWEGKLRGKVAAGDIMRGIKFYMMGRDSGPENMRGGVLRRFAALPDHITWSEFRNFFLQLDIEKTKIMWQNFKAEEPRRHIDKYWQCTEVEDYKKALQPLFEYEHKQWRNG
eukprot:TRINITY_DN24717_c0_g1_i1.p1 TRINITY_DN24717_c0_g1~~TRINITY_DN24717_c0_g1_i1.p1  ORF type:complete len:965 (+),score=97.79 TRINITY_DN24717_c0_g1_i1:100-2994(+)